MKARTLERFTDLKEEKVREVGDEFVLTRERYEYIVSRGKFIEEVQEEVKVGAGGRKKRTKNH
jgi:hypothetical protein